MILKFFKKYGWIYIPGVIFLAINSRIQTWAPRELGRAIDMLEGLSADKSTVYRQAGIIVLIALGIFFSRFIWRMCIVLNARKMEIFLREELFVKLQNLPVSFFAKQRSGDLMAYAINDVGAVRMTFGPVLAMGLNGIITGGLAIFSMAEGVSPKLTALALIPIPIAMISIFSIGKLINRRSRRVQQLFARLSGFVNESIMGIRVIKTFAGEDRWLGTFEDTSTEMRDANVKLTDTSALIQPVTVVTFGISYAVSLIYGGNLVAGGAIGIGDLVAFQGYLLLIQMPVISIGRIVNMFQRGLASYTRLKAVFDEPGIPEEELVPHTRKLEGNISARNLSYTYPGMKSPAISNISFDIAAGETLCIAGATGSGKTTLISLLMKFLTAPEGTLFIDGEDINQIPAHGIREQIGYVPQDGFLFSTTVRDNIRFYKPGADDADIKLAAEMSNIHREIEAFRSGYDTMVGERGTHLSGGQKQRIALARALLRDPDILILDDTLSAVDTLTEQKIMYNLEGVLGHKTSIIISHRLTSFQNADLILWLSGGQITESGTHDELMALNGEYASTFIKQSKEGERDE